MPPLWVAYNNLDSACRHCFSNADNCTCSRNLRNCNLLKVIKFAILLYLVISHFNVGLQQLGSHLFRDCPSNADNCELCASTLHNPTLLKVRPLQLYILSYEPHVSGLPITWSSLSWHCLRNADNCETPSSNMCNLSQRGWRLQNYYIYHVSAPHKWAYHNMISSCLSNSDIRESHSSNLSNINHLRLWWLPITIFDLLWATS